MNVKIPLTQSSLQELKHSNESAQNLLKRLRIKGWPRVITPEPNKHFLVNN